MNKKTLLILLLVSLLVLTSCTGARVQYRPQVTDYFSGKQGLEVNFLDQAPPQETYESRAFDIQLEVHNKGSFSLEEPYVALFDVAYDSSKVVLLDSSDTNQDAFLNVLTDNGDTAQAQTKSLHLEGRNINWPLGETDYVYLERFQTRDIVGNFQATKTTFIVKACYPYETNFATEICIDTDVDGLSQREEVCRLENLNFVRGQGAPIGVVGVESTVVPRGPYVQPQFTIHLEHFGDGTISYRDILDESYDPAQCNDIKREDLNKISIRATLGEDDLDCLPAEVIFRNGEAKIQCRLTQDKIMGVSSNYRTSLVVKAAYLYSETFKEELSILKSQGDLFDDEVVAENGISPCFSWQGRDDKTNKCIDVCEYKAKYDPDYFEKTTLKTTIQNKELADNFDKEYLWKQVSCNYNSIVTCKDNPDLCLLQSGLCQPGSFCGLPTCVLDNTPPRFIEMKKIGTNYYFHCSDSDDTKNLKGTCGCTNVSYYKFEDDRTDCKNESNYNDAQTGTPDLLGVKFEVKLNGALNDTDKPFLCLKIQDKLGQNATTIIRYPYNT